MHDAVLDGRIALVTGGGRGIGRAIAGALAQDGAAVVVAARSREQIEAVAAELRKEGQRAVAIGCDVTKERDVERLARAAANELGRIDILVNNAGAASSAPLHRLTLEEWNRMFAVNATGAFLCTRAFLPGMTERGWGRVVNVASIAGLRGAPFIAAYAAAKHALVGFTTSVAAEVAGSGVTVNAVCPGYVDTEMTRESIDRIVAKTGKTRAAALEAMLATAGQPRLLAPDEVAKAVAVLCGDGAAHLTGQMVALAAPDEKALPQL